MCLTQQTMGSVATVDGVLKRACERIKMIITGMEEARRCFRECLHGLTASKLREVLAERKRPVMEFGVYMDEGINDNDQ